MTPLSALAARDLLAHGEPAHVPPIDVAAVFSAWTLDPVALAVILAAAVAYLLGVRMLIGRGNRWPWGRTAAFVVGGCGTAVLATQSSLGTYDKTLLSVHMVQHMLLSMLVPLFLALGAPVTLALRTFSPTPRRWLLAVLHSRLARVLTFPPLTLVLFVVSPWALYFSGWYEATLRSDVLHDLLHMHFVLVGALFFWPLVGVDPVPGRVPYPFRMIMVFLTLPFHAFLGVTVMGMQDLIAGDYYLGLERAWPPDPSDDQYVAGSILWGSGDLVGLVVFAVLFVQWVKDSMREAKREDRRLDRLEAQERTRARGSGESDRDRTDTIGP